MKTPLETVLCAIDAANSADPNLEDGVAVSLRYGQRMSADLATLFPAASDELQIAARGQHIERWLLPRADFPEGREGYLAWRREQGKRHAERVCGLMLAAGYGEASLDLVGRMLRKEGIKREPQVQALEDVICFTFIRHYLAQFATTQDPEQLLRIVQKTARKMSPEAREKALVEFDMPPAFAEAFSA